MVGAVAVIGLALLAGVLLTKRRRAAERRQLEVPEFSAAEFQRFFDEQAWAGQQLPPGVGPETSPGMPPVGPGTDPVGRAHPQFVPPPPADSGGRHGTEGRR